LAIRQTTGHESTLRGKTDLGRLIHAFEVTNRTLNKSPKTTAWYSNNLRLFKDHMIARGHSLAIDDIGLEEAREYVLYLQERKKFEGHPLTPTRDQKPSPRTVQAHVQTLKAFSTWLFEEGYTASNTLKRLGCPRVPKKYVDVLREEEVRRILSCIRQDDAIGMRNMAIVATLLDTGLRLAELVNLKQADAHIEEGQLKVMGKGSRERLVPIGASTQRLLLRYVYRARPEAAAPSVDNLFLEANGRPLTINCVRLMLERLGRRSGVTRLHAHLCRHTFATNYLLNGGDVFSLQQILGHSSLEMVRRYITLASQFVIEQHQRFSPLDAMHPKITKHALRRLPSRSS
jgi:site-specific recombinase XerD